MKTGKVFKRTWRWALRKVNGFVDDHTSAEQNIQEAMDNERQRHARLKQAAARVLAQRLELQRSVSETTKQRDEKKLMLERAIARADDPRTDTTCLTLAQQVQTLNDQIASSQQAWKQSEQAAEIAQQRYAESVARLEGYEAEAQQLKSQAAQVELAKQIRQSTSELEMGDTVNFDSVRKRLSSEAATEIAFEQLERPVSGIAELEREVRQDKAASLIDDMLAIEG